MCWLSTIDEHVLDQSAEKSAFSEVDSSALLRKPRCPTQKGNEVQSLKASVIMATPCPPPVQALAKPYFCFRLRSSSNRV